MLLLQLGSLDLSIWNFREGCLLCLCLRDLRLSLELSLGFFGCAQCQCAQCPDEGNGDERCNAVFGFHLVFCIEMSFSVSAFVVMAEGVQESRETELSHRWRG